MLKKKVATYALVGVLTAGTLGLGIGAGATYGYGLGLNESNNIKVEVNELREQYEQVINDLKKDQEDQNGFSIDNASPVSLNTDNSSISSIIKKVADSVVSINTTVTSTTVFNQQFESDASGSGIIFKEDAEKIYVVTNYHVLSDASSATISLDDTVTVPASAVGGDQAHDIAIISVLKSDLQKAGVTQYKIASFADSSVIEVGDMAIAIGNALGEGKSATLGIVSAINKSISVDANTSLNVIQTDAAINFGNSGGALINHEGKVIGINTAKLSSTGVEGMGYAIPANDVVKMIDELLKAPSIRTPYVGISMATITEELKEQYSLPTLGAYIQQVEINSAAQKAGLRQSDIITAINDQEITTAAEVTDYISKCKVGDIVTFSLIRNGRVETKIEVTIGTKGLNF